MTYNRMEAKPIAGEHCRFCGDASAPFIKHGGPSSGYAAIPPLCRFEVAGAGKLSTQHFTLCYSHYIDGRWVPGRPVRRAERY